MAFVLARILGWKLENIGFSPGYSQMSLNKLCKLSGLHFIHFFLKRVLNLAIFEHCSQKNSCHLSFGEEIDLRKNPEEFK